MSLEACLPYGPIDVVVWSQVAERQWRIFLEGACWDRADGVGHLIANRLIDLSSLLGALDNRSGRHP
jgi:error-prone DNA polymerase